VRGVAREQAEITGVSGCYNCSATQIPDRDDECVDSVFGACAGGAEELPGPHADATVDRVHLDSFSAEPGEHGGIARMPAHDLGEYGGHSSYQELASAYLSDKGPDSVSAMDRPMSE